MTSSQSNVCVAPVAGRLCSRDAKFVARWDKQGARVPVFLCAAHAKHSKVVHLQHIADYQEPRRGR